MSNVTLQFKTIIEKLHNVAYDFATKEYPSIRLDNSLFNEHGELLSNKGGEYGILLKTQEDGIVNPEKLKKECFEMTRLYVKYFVGEEESTYVKMEHLSPIWNTSLSSDDEQEPNTVNGKTPEQIDQELRRRQEENGLEGESINTFNNSRVLTDTFDPIYDKISYILFENNEKCVILESEPPLSSDDIIIGYRVNYLMEIQGKKTQKFEDSLAQRTKGLWGGMLADLRNIKIDINKQKINIGQLFDPDKWREAVGDIDIDVDNVKQNIDNIFRQRFSNSEVYVNVWESDELISFLNRKGRITPEIRTKIKNSEYSITINVQKKDPNYNKYDQDLIAQMCSDAFGTKETLRNSNGITYRDVIKLDNCAGRAYDSMYDKKQKYKTSPIKESKQLGIDDIQKSGDYQNIANQIFTQKIQNEFGETTQCGYVTLSSFQTSFGSEIDDVEFIDEIKKVNDNVFYSILETSIPQVDESFSRKYIENKLISMLFEETESYIGDNSKIKLQIQEGERFQQTKQDLTNRISKVMDSTFQKFRTIIYSRFKIKLPSDNIEPQIFLKIKKNEVSENEIIKEADASPSETSRFFFVIPDPFDTTTHKVELEDSQTDMYIIPHKKLKKLDRKHEQSVGPDGTVTAHTSNAEYKP